MGLVTAKEVAQAIKVDQFGFLGTAMGWTLMKILKIDTMNRIYNSFTAPRQQMVKSLGPSLPRKMLRPLVMLPMSASPFQPLRIMLLRLSLKILK